jgi:hypothetical protein
MKRIFLLLITLTTLVNISYASFPVLETNKTEIAFEKNTYIDPFYISNMNPWYSSVKNTILFLASSVFGLGLLSVFISEGFIVSDREGPLVLLLLPLLLASALVYVSISYGKKIWGDTFSSEDKLAKKMVYWIVSISIFLVLFLGLFGGYSGMGG